MRGYVTTVKRKKTDTVIAKGCGSGFGFIKDENGKDRFFGHSEVIGVPFDQLQENTPVEFEPFELEGRGLRARQVRVLPGA